MENLWKNNSSVLRDTLDFPLRDKDRSIYTYLYGKSKDTNIYRVILVETINSTSGEQRVL